MNVKHKLQRGQLRKKRNEIVFFFDRLNRNLRAVELDRNDSNTRSKRDQPPTTRIRRACISNFDLNRFDSSFERIRFASLLHGENRIYLVREFFKFSTSLIPCRVFFLSWNWIILFFFCCNDNSNICKLLVINVGKIYILSFYVLMLSIRQANKKDTSFLPS